MKGLLSFFKKSKTIVLLSDFGYVDNYLAEIKGVIRSISQFEILDLSHGVAPYSIVNAQFFLFSSYHYFPQKTLFCILVDPDFWSKKDLLIAIYRGYYFLVPDNGIISVFEEAELKVFKVKKCYLDNYQNFIGRDLIAPLAVKLAGGVPLKKLAISSDDYLKAGITTVELSTGSSVKVKIIHVDRFGNLVTEIKSSSSLFQYDKVQITISGAKYSCRIRRDNQELLDNEICFIKGSSGFVEIVIKQRSASQELGLTIESEPFMKISKI